MAKSAAVPKTLVCASSPTKACAYPLCRRNDIPRWPWRQLHPKEQQHDTHNSAKEAAQDAAHESAVAAHGEALRVPWTRHIIYNVIHDISWSCSLRALLFGRPCPEGLVGWSSVPGAAAVMTTGAASTGWEHMSSYLVASQIDHTALSNSDQPWSWEMSAMAASAMALQGKGLPTPTTLWGLPM